MFFFSEKIRLDLNYRGLTRKVALAHVSPVSLEFSAFDVPLERGSNIHRHPVSLSSNIIKQEIRNKIISIGVLNNISKLNLIPIQNIQNITIRPSQWRRKKKGISQSM